MRRAVQTTVRSWRVALLSVLMMAWAAPASAFGIDWSAIGWVENVPGPQVFLNVDGSGVDLTVSYTTNMWDGPPNLSLPAVGVPADQDDLLRFTNDQVAAITRTTVTLEFSTPVFITSTGLEALSIINGLYQEHGIIEAFDAGGVPVLATSYTTNTPLIVILDVDGNAEYVTIATGSQALGEYGDAYVSYTKTPIKRIEFSLDVTAPGGDDLIFGWASILIPNTTFRVPEPEALLLFGSGLAGLAMLGRRPRQGGA